MMLLKFHRPSIQTDRLLEFRVWTEAALWPLPMTEGFGLANSASKLGFYATVVKDNMALKLFAPKRYGPPGLMNAAFSLAAIRYRYLHEKASRRGIRSVKGAVTLGLIKDALARRIPPIVMVDQGWYAPDKSFPEGVLHWIVVTGADEEGVVIHDPDLGGSIMLSKEQFEKSMDLSRFTNHREILLIEILSSSTNNP